MKTRPGYLLATTALVSAGLATASPAHANDEVNWEWTLNLSEQIGKTIRIDSVLQPTGLVTLQDLQVSIGDITAISIIAPGDPTDPGGPGGPGGPEDPGGGDPNNDPGTPIDNAISNVVFYIVNESGELVKEVKIEYADLPEIKDAEQPRDLYSVIEDVYAESGESISGHTVKGGSGEGSITTIGTIPNGVVPEDFTGSGDRFIAELDYDPSTGFIFDDGDEVAQVAPVTQDQSNSQLASITFQVPGVQPLGPDQYAVVNVPHATGLDATVHLPEVESIATAVANNVSIESDVMIELHDTQIAFGGFTENIDPDAAARVGTVFGSFYQPDQAEDAPIEDDVYTGNIGVASGLALIVAGAQGAITPGSVTALSDVGGVLNASVDGAATAVANSKSITLDAATPGDAVFVGDVTQFAYMDVAAISDVRSVSVSGYTSLGLIDRPLVSSVALGVGNNLAIDVRSPAGAE